MTMFAAAKNQAADAITVTHVSLHNGEPGTGASNELPTGVYARKAIAFDAAVDGVREQTADVFVDVPAGATVSHYVLWDGATAKKKGAFAATEEYAAQGQHKIAASTITITG